MKRLGMTVSVLLAVLLACAGSCPALGQTEADERAASAELMPAEIEVMRLVNGFRISHGLPPHQVNAALSRASRKHAENMARHGRLTHVLDGKGPSERALAEGFGGPVAENCADGSQGTPQAFFDFWVTSIEHRANMLRPEMDEMGVGVARGASSDEVYCAAMFGVSR